MSKPCLFCARPRPVLAYSVSWARQFLCRKCRVEVGKVPYNRKILDSPTFKAEPLSEAWFEAGFSGVSEMAGMTPGDLDNKYGPVVAEVASSSDPRRSYQVRCKDGGVFSCTCAGFKFRRTCRHIDYCKEKNIRVAEVVDPLVKAIESAFTKFLAMHPRDRYGRQWLECKNQIADYIRNECSLAPVEDTKAERPPFGAGRVIILPD